MAGLSFDLVDGRKKPQKEPAAFSPERIRQQEQEIPSRIEERGTIQENLAERFRKVLPGGGEEGGLRQAGDIAMLGLEAATIPTRAVESAVSGAALEFQKEPLPTKSIDKAIIEGAKGLALQKQPKFEDVFLGAGATPMQAKAAGLGTTVLLPVAIINKLNKTMGALTTVTDKKLEGAANLALKAGKQAETVVGSSVDDAFSVVDDAAASSDDVLAMLSKMPKSLQKALGDNKELFNALMNNPVVANLRKVKQWLGKFRPTKFGRQDRGLQESIDDEAINASYAAMKELIRKIAESRVGKGAAEAIDEADDAFSALKDATRFITKSTKDGTLRRATKGASFAKQLKGLDSTTRAAVETVRQAGGDAAVMIKEATRLLKRFDTLRKAVATAKGLGRVGIAGAVAGKVAGLSQKKGSHETFVGGAESSK